MKNINTFAKSVTKLMEVIHWIGAALVAAAAVCAPNQFLAFLSLDAAASGAVTVSTYGFEVSTLLSAGTTAFTLFGIGAAVILVAMAMVWRNLFLIFKKSENATLFQKDNFRMIKEIGIFAIAIPVVGLIMSAVIRLVCGVDAAEVSVHLGGILAGAVILCLNRNLIRSASSVKTAEAAL